MVVDEDGKLLTSTPKDASKTVKSSKRPEGKSTPRKDGEEEADDSGINMSSSALGDGSSALDLSGPVKRDVDDLALSPPQNYTAQVRDVIRQRLLANRSQANSGSSSTGAGGDRGDRGPATHNMPRMVSHINPDRRKK